MASVSAAPTKAVAQTSTARVHAITQRVTATSATAALPIVQRVSTVKAAAVRVRDRARAAPTSQTTRHTLVRDPST